MHRVRPRVVTAIGMGLAVLGLVGCTMVGDRLTGLNANRNAPTGCIKACNDQYAALFKLEQKRHIAAQEACKAQPDGPARDACLDAEQAQHNSNMDQLTDDKVACHKNCHHQGAGNAG